MKHENLDKYNKYDKQKRQDKPKVSIIMGIYNCSNTLQESIDSVLAQTYTNWELIMCDDGSTDHTLNIAKQYESNYSNIIVLKNDKNCGLAHSLNRCLRVATGQYIARQDGDDRSHPQRIEREVQILNTYPQYDIVSTGMSFFDADGEWGQSIPIEKPEAIHFIQQTPFCHAAAMVRKDALLCVQGYNESAKLLRVEDYDLWFRLYEKGCIGYNITEPLYEVRDDRAAFNRRNVKHRLNEAYVRYRGYRRLKLPMYAYAYVFRALVLLFVPNALYQYLRKKKYDFLPYESRRQL